MLANRRGWVVAAAGPLLVLAAGCVTLDTNKAREAPTGTAVTAVTTWQNYVLFGADTVHEGARIPGLAGRLYLFSPSDIPVAAAGKVEVRLYAEPPNPAAPNTPLEIWQFDPATLKGKLQRDAIGWGYSLQLPWQTYKPELAQVRLTVRFDPANGGMPIYAPETRLSLHGDGPPKIAESTKMPGAVPVPAG